MLNSVYLLWAFHVNNPSIDAGHTDEASSIPYVNLLLDSPDITVGPQPFDPSLLSIIIAAHGILMAVAWAVLSVAGTDDSVFVRGSCTRAHVCVPSGRVTRGVAVAGVSGLCGDVRSRVEAMVPCARGSAGADGAAHHRRLHGHLPRQIGRG